MWKRLKAWFAKHWWRDVCSECGTQGCLEENIETCWWADMPDEEKTWHAT